MVLPERHLAKPRQVSGKLPRVRVLLLVFANKHTGAAAVAELCCRALASVGVEARLLFVAGRNLEQRLAGLPWAVPGLLKERSPVRIWRNLATIRREADAADVVIAHLPHDHLLAVAAGAHRRALLVRSVRHPRHLRADPWHRALGRRARGLLLAHRSMAEAAPHAFGPRPTLALPVPLGDRFHPAVDGRPWRRRLELPAGAPVLGMVGKLAEGRGFDLLLATAAGCTTAPHVVVVGHGEAEPSLRRQASTLGLDRRVHWLGYRDAELPELYAAMDVVLHAGGGSDWGHRAVSEAQGCGRPVVAAAADGVADLVEDGVTGRIVAPDPGSLAAAVDALLADPVAARTIGRAAAAATATRRLEPSGRRLAGFLDGLRGAPAP